MNVAINRGCWGIHALGVLVCLIGAFLMVHGSILGDRTTGTATLAGIIGIGIITHANKRIKR